MADLTTKSELFAQASPSLERVGTFATYGGSASALFFGLKADEFAAIAGVVIAVIGLLLTWWYKHQHLKLAKRLALTAAAATAATAVVTGEAHELPIAPEDGPPA